MLKIAFGDITNLKNVDVIVNCAKKSLRGGAGVDGAIHSKAGHQLMAECRKLGECAVGESKITSGYDLGIPYIIHTVGVIYHEPKWAKENEFNQAELLANGYKSALNLAKENNLKRISVPAISTGAYSYPTKESCEIALNVITSFLKENNEFEIILVLYTDELYNEYIRQLNALDIEYSVEIIEDNDEEELTFKNMRNYNK